MDGDDQRKLQFPDTGCRSDPDRSDVMAKEKMTREEAINELKYAQAMCEFDPSTGKVGFRNTEDKRQYEAFAMAIEALKQSEQWEAEVSARNYCEECVHNEVCQWYPYEGCEFRMTANEMYRRGFEDGRKSEWTAVAEEKGEQG